MAEYNYTCGDCLYVQICEGDPSLRAFDRKNTAYCKAFKNAADVVEVKHGHWISQQEAETIDDYEKAYCCSICGRCDWDCTESESFNYCPHCGAKMDGERRSE